MIVTVLPAYNEAVAMPRLLARLQAALRVLPGPTKVIVVDDGSGDGTADVAARFARDGQPVQVIRHVRNRGLHGAIDTGFRAALAECGPDDWVVTMDADDTHPPDLIPVMLGLTAGDSQIVIASRFRKGAEWHGRTWDRILFSYGVSWLFRLVWPMKGVRDYTCGFRAYRAGLLRQGYERWGDAFVSEPSFACVLDILWKLSRFDPVIHEVPLVLHYDRKPGSSKMNVPRTIWRTLALLMKRRLGRSD